jgi:hypothetical protein
VFGTTVRLIHEPAPGVTPLITRGDTVPIAISFSNGILFTKENLKDSPLARVSLVEHETPTNIKGHDMSASRSNTNTDIFTRRLANPMPATSARTQSLTTAVEAAVSHVDDDVLSPLTGRQRLSAVDAKRLLALLSWSYARELYSSAEIHSRLRRGGTAELWDSGIPDKDGICRFRIENRQALQHCLQVALRFLAAQKVEEGFVTRVNESHIAAEASRRIITSIFIDSAEDTAVMAA